MVAVLLLLNMVDKLTVITNRHMAVVNHNNSLVALCGQGSYGGDSYQQNQPPMNQPNYTRVDEDPFANSKGPIEVSEDDLPF